jgi:putative transcription antitermination factor YqgF
MFDQIGLDWGTKFIGMAFKSSLTGLTIPFQEVVLASNFFEVFDQQVKQKEPKTVIVGMPLNFRLEPTEKSQMVKFFIDEISKKYPNLEIKTVNERETSKISLKKLGKNPDMIHNLCAAEILKRYKV